MSDSVERVCELCGGEIPKWKMKGTKVCSAKCRFEIKEKKKVAKKAVKKVVKKATKRNSGPLLHACLSNVLDAAKPACLCRERLTDRQAQKMIESGEAVNFQSRTSEYLEGAALLMAGKHLKFPRAATVERPHIERLTDHSRRKDTADESLDAARKAIEEDRALRGQEEIVRLQIYGELTAALRRKWIVEVSPDEYDKAESEAEGRCLFWFGDERTEGGIGVDVDSRSLAPLAPIEANHREEEIDAADAEVKVESLENINFDPIDISAISLDEVIEKETQNEEMEEEFI